MKKRGGKMGDISSVILALGTVAALLVFPFTLFLYQSGRSDRIEQTHREDINRLEDQREKDRDMTDTLKREVDLLKFRQGKCGGN